MNKPQNGVFIAGLIIFAAFLTVRLAMARTFRDLMLASGTALMELGFVVYLDHKGRDLDAERDAWRADRRIRKRTEAWMREALEERDRRIEMVERIKRERAEIEERDLKGRVWGNHLPTNQELAKAAVRASYLAQIVLNKASSIVPSEGL